MSVIEILAGPVIGGVIGYFTNYIAVKMLFRPLKPVKIGGRTLPFTPGIIPKGKPRLAKALGKGGRRKAPYQRRYPENAPVRGSER